MFGGRPVRIPRFTGYRAPGLRASAARHDVPNPRRIPTSARSHCNRPFSSRSPRVHRPTGDPREAQAPQARNFSRFSRSLQPPWTLKAVDDMPDAIDLPSDFGSAQLHCSAVDVAVRPYPWSRGSARTRRCRRSRPAITPSISFICSSGCHHYDNLTFTRTSGVSESAEHNQGSTFRARFTGISTGRLVPALPAGAEDGRAVNLTPESLALLEAISTVSTTEHGGNEDVANEHAHGEAPGESRHRHRGIEGDRRLDRQTSGGSGRRRRRELRVEQGRGEPGGRRDRGRRGAGGRGASRRRPGRRRRAPLLGGEGDVRPGRHRRQQRRDLRVRADRAGHRGPLPPAVRPQRPRAAS